MCGLAVTVSFDGRPADPVVLQRMADVLQHRGPDDSGLATYDHVGFAFRRLAILDLSASGHQPMESADGRLAIVFNGEIYNYIELKRELEQLGHSFRSASDTEVLLASYRQWGTECVSRFNGMWAFVIYDKVRRSLFASRDRFGVKPLYRFKRDGMLILASEVKAIVASGLYEPATNWRTASKFLVRGRVDDDNDTFYRGVDQVPAGSTLEIDAEGRTQERAFWSLDRLAPEPPVNGARPDQTFRALLEDSVRLRMRSDVPVGVCLSGGIDSNAIISFMSDLWPKGAAGRLQAFSYIPEQFSEADYIHESITRTGAELNELAVTPERLWDNLPTAIWHYDGPVHSATALVGFELMRLARSTRVKVVLNGQGADEVYAGYPHYFKYYWSDLLRQGHLTQAWQEISTYSRAHRLDRVQLFRSAAAQALRGSLETLPGYLAMAARRRARRLHGDAWYTPQLTRELDPWDVGNPTMNLDAALRYSVEKRSLPVYLRVEDRNSMAHSVEARLPFLDYRLVSFGLSLPAGWKLRGPWNKYVVREAVQGVIAERVRTRQDKMGFPTPSREWFAGSWYEPTRDLLASRTLRESGIVNVEKVEQELDRHRAGEIDATARLFRLVEFGVWLDATRADAKPAGHQAGPALDVTPALQGLPA